MSTFTRAFVPYFDNGVVSVNSVITLEVARVVSDVDMEVTSMNLDFRRQDLVLADFDNLPVFFPSLRIMRIVLDPRSSITFWDFNFDDLAHTFKSLTSLTISLRDADRVDVLGEWGSLKDALTTMHFLEYLHLDVLASTEKIEVFTPDTLPVLKVLIGDCRFASSEFRLCAYSQNLSSFQICIAPARRAPVFVYLLWKCQRGQSSSPPWTGGGICHLLIATTFMSYAHSVPSIAPTSPTWMWCAGCPTCTPSS